MTSTTRHETEIVLDEKVPAVHITREFDAPVAKVFRAHVEPDLVKQWLGPHGYEMVIDHFECRTGGSYRYLHINGEESYGFFGSFHEVRPDELIVQTFCYEGEPDGIALERLRLEELPGDRCRLSVMSLCDSFEGRDAIIASGMEVGIRESYERLDDLLG